MTTSKNEDPNQCYSTVDIYVAASLLAAGFPLLNISKINKQYTFHIAKQSLTDTSIDEVELQYWRGELLLEAKLLWSCYRELKNKMYHNGD